MIPELGHFSLILALCLAIAQGVIPLIGVHRNDPAWMSVGARAAHGQFLFLTLAFLALAHAFVVKDFSVLYVAQNANSVLPLPYRISAVWGAHEGSLLLWAFILGGWTVAVARFSRTLSRAFSARVIAIMGLIGVGFLLFLLGTSNPFERLIPAAMEGRDLNPLLQDPGLILHPPMLYMGYVGMAVPFAFAVAALLEGRLDAAWVRWTRPWTTLAWVFLTLGIALGSWWAYYELGWGGWWFWDPVENASLMPWLVATALLHSLAVSEKRDALKAWTVLLAIFGFSLSLLGTFLVRSGVLVSVHAFATDPARGVFILAFLAVVVGSALALFAWRGREIATGGRFGLLSREIFLLGNNLLLVVACATVLLGTLYPLLMDILGLGKISVGPPYFNRVFVPLMLPLAFFLAMGPLARWRQDSLAGFGKRLWVGVLASGLLGTLFFGAFAGFGAVAGTPPRSVLGSALILVALMIAVLIVITAGRGLAPQTQVRDDQDRKRDPLLSLKRLPLKKRALVGMAIAHIGVAVFIVGVTLASALSVERDVRLAPGDTKTLAGHQFTFHGVARVLGPNYRAEQGDIRVSRNGREIARLRPEKRTYLGREQPMTEAAIDPGFTRDIYVALGEPLGAGAWAVRLYYKPFVRWIWLGPLLMALGGLWAASDRRYRAAVRRGL
uniref:Cytochrome c-type biogenesis protein CcmF n=1 Tax=Candidatus Kentrum eta TaxID=2126337 RepID=A0A450U8V4_9GAMM|nr:MAG: cytochrome c-type biogenesis protein CcmF [Candidatus Kentron sp. H]VFJ92843.1 MAG: cytochrome c-type biogenesis protein CcmF [Candidatus Kentron sp. H]VFJ94814.1 MAG: cytochrome c-type biogenesis protein CcmF [Candidatus Kentron sp. H]